MTDAADFIRKAHQRNRKRVIKRQSSTGAPGLPDSLWTRHAYFRNIAQTADHLSIGADGLLYADLITSGLMVPRTVVLPRIVGRFGSLNGAVVLAGPPGIGKGAALDAAEEIGFPDETTRPWMSVGGDGPRVKIIATGTGEGVTKEFYDIVSEPDGVYASGPRHGQPKSKQVRKQVIDGVLVRCDEVKMLEAIGAERSGATLFPMIRQAMSGERIGFSYAGADKHNVLEPNDYRLMFAVGAQPELMNVLFSQANNGTPQRFVYASMYLNGLGPTPAKQFAHHPAAEITIDDWDGLERYGRLRLLEVDQGIASEIVRNRRRTMSDPDVYEAHGDLLRLKMAAWLGVRLGEPAATTTTWDYAGEMYETSLLVGEWCRKRIATEQAEQVKRSATVSALRQRTVSSAQDLVQANALTVSRHVARHYTDTGTPCTSKCMQPSVDSKYRSEGWFPEALTRAVALNLIMEVDGAYVASNSTN
jgi:hypothetical protein